MRKLILACCLLLFVTQPGRTADVDFNTVLKNCRAIAGEAKAIRAKAPPATRVVPTHYTGGNYHSLYGLKGSAHKVWLYNVGNRFWPGYPFRPRAPYGHVYDGPYVDKGE